ncbi:hypothetical protein LXL04_019579 [Taraxacum kok-saghyz]
MKLKEIKIEPVIDQKRNHERSESFQLQSRWRMAELDFTKSIHITPPPPPQPPPPPTTPPPPPPPTTHVAANNTTTTTATTTTTNNNNTTTATNNTSSYLPPPPLITTANLTTTTTSKQCCKTRPTRPSTRNRRHLLHSLNLFQKVSRRAKGVGKLGFGKWKATANSDSASGRRRLNLHSHFLFSFNIPFRLKSLFTALFRSLFRLMCGYNHILFYDLCSELLSELLKGTTPPPYLCSDLLCSLHPVMVEVEVEVVSPNCPSFIKMCPVPCSSADEI